MRIETQISFAAVVSVKFLRIGISDVLLRVVDCVHVLAEVGMEHLVVQQEVGPLLFVVWGVFLLLPDVLQDLQRIYVDVLLFEVGLNFVDKGVVGLDLLVVVFILEPGEVLVLDVAQVVQVDHILLRAGLLFVLRGVLGVLALGAELRKRVVAHVAKTSWLPLPQAGLRVVLELLVAFELLVVALAGVVVGIQAFLGLNALPLVPAIVYVHV
mmetsp:Transcript_74877/g.161942  ORF Transcript_74877/g.161942 Transcript_74877/m.161942 type:complete len:212 (-) Transcript_74877:145-780(-)